PRGFMRGHYGNAFVGNGSRLPEATGTYRSYAVVFRERVDELDAAIQQADRDYAAKYQTDWRATGQKPGEGLDQSRFVFSYWLPFAKAWNVARAQLLAGKMDPAAALVLLSWYGLFNDLKMDSGASWGLDTTAPNVMIRGSSPGAVALGYDSATSADNSHRGEARRVVAELARQLWNSPSRDTVVAFGYMLGPTGTVVQEFTAPRP